MTAKSEQIRDYLVRQYKELERLKIVENSDRFAETLMIEQSMDERK